MLDTLALSLIFFSTEKEFKRRSYGYIAGGSEYVMPTVTSGYRLNSNHVGLDISGSVIFPITKNKDLNVVLPKEVRGKLALSM